MPHNSILGIGTNFRRPYGGVPGAVIASESVILTRVSPSAGSDTSLKEDGKAIQRNVALLWQNLVFGRGHSLVCMHDFSEYG